MGREIREAVEKYRDYVVSLRRHFHSQPELSTKEFKTQEKIMDELSKLGLEARKAASTGVVAEIEGGLPGKTIAIRADMDGLPIQDECGQPYQSQNPGVCHACGHDGHVAMLLGVANIIRAMRAELPGKVRLLFQPSEEFFPGGASPLIKAGVLEGVDAIIGAHLWQPIPAGRLGISYGCLMAQPGGFAITVKGRGGHGSMPHKAVDPIWVGTQIVQSIDAISGNNIDPLESEVVLVTIFKAGQIRNVIPDTAYIEGTIRVFETATLTRIHERIEQITKGICAAHGAEYTFTGTSSYPPVINNPAITACIRDAGIAALGEDAVFETKVLASEDFSYYQQLVPGALMFIGAGNDDRAIYSHHHPKFDIDEQALVHGVEIMVRTVQNYLAQPKR